VINGELDIDLYLRGDAVIAVSIVGSRLFGRDSLCFRLLRIFKWRDVQNTLLGDELNCSLDLQNIFVSIVSSIPQISGSREYIFDPQDRRQSGINIRQASWIYPRICFLVNLMLFNATSKGRRLYDLVGRW
jgi:hypothetical protein